MTTSFDIGTGLTVADRDLAGDRDPALWIGDGAEAVRVAGRTVRIVNLDASPREDLSDGAGGRLDGVFGHAGVRDFLAGGDPIGVDKLVMQAGTAFGLHTHPGAHVLVVVEGRGVISFEGAEYEMRAGDTVFVPATYAHAVGAAKDSGVSLLAFGVPHMPLSSDHRMTLVEEQR
jgi:quercetin dioxygenase-like cupin family protein